MLDDMKVLCMKGNDKKHARNYQSFKMETIKYYVTDIEFDFD